jgi:hypothetical protein
MSGRSVGYSRIVWAAARRAQPQRAKDLSEMIGVFEYSHAPEYPDHRVQLLLSAVRKLVTTGIAAPNNRKECE